LLAALFEVPHLVGNCPSLRGFLSFCGSAAQPDDGNVTGVSNVTGIKDLIRLGRRHHRRRRVLDSSLRRTKLPEGACATTERLNCQVCLL
jgi:hypothetical protein